MKECDARSVVFAAMYPHGATEVRKLPTGSVLQADPTINAETTTAQMSPGRIRRARRATNRRTDGSFDQLLVTRKPLVTKKVSTPTVPSVCGASGSCLPVSGNECER